MLPRQSVKVATIAACIVVAAAPPLGFTRFLESHVAASAEHTLTDYAERMIARVESMIGEATSKLAALYLADAMNCDLRAREAMRHAVAASRVIQEIVVTGDDTQCGSPLVETPRRTLSDSIPVNATIDLFVTEDDRDRRALAVRFRPREGATLVAHFMPESVSLDMLPAGWRQHGHALVRLDDGTIFEEAPLETALTPDHAGPTISVEVTSQRHPVSAGVKVLQVAVMKDYGGLRAYALIVMGVFSALVLGFAATIARRQNLLSDDIAAGLRRGEFIPYYQPVLSLGTGRLVGCEVLVRRRRPDGTIEVPASFIAQAELDGQIVAMTQQLMRLVIRDLHEHYARHRHLTVGFNLCAQHFRDYSIISDLDRLFSRSPIAFKQLVFEVTERFPLADMAKAQTIIAKLQATGARVALDDAGTGHSGLAALHRLGMDIVKIDKIFIDTIDSETTHAPIVDSLVDLAKSYGMSVVAEGVESLDQVRYLKAKGVDAAQGYLFAPPLPASSYLALLDALWAPRDKEQFGRAVDAA